MKTPFENRRSDAQGVRASRPISGTVMSRHVEWMLDQALEDSFPASDPLSSMVAAHPSI